MINYKDLMIGNWVYDSDKSKFPMQVVGIGDDYCYLNFEGNESDFFDGIDKYMMPIEVTEELLLSNGFVIFQLEGCEDYYLIILEDSFIEIDESPYSTGKKWHCHIDNAKRDPLGGFDFQYLHELQNGIRLITCKDLKVKL